MSIKPTFKWLSSVASVLGAIAIPAGLDGNGLPIGIQIVGRPAAEATIIALAGQIEAAKPFPVLDLNR